MCDRFDIGGLSTNYHEDTQEATIFIYDGYEGGIGITEKAVDVFVDLLNSTIDLLNNCKCKKGCPSCIYSPKCGNDNKPLHKGATKYILEYMKKLISNDFAGKKEEIIEVEAEIVETGEFGEAYNLYKSGDYSSSKDILNNILSNDKKHVKALALMAQILYNQDQKDIALLFTKKALAIDKSNEMANELEVLLTKKSEVESETQLSSLDDVEVLFEEAYDLFNQGDLDSALPILEKLLDFDSRHSEALALMGLIHYHSGFFPKAVEYYRMAIKINKHGEMVNELKMRVS